MYSILPNSTPSRSYSKISRRHIISDDSTTYTTQYSKAAICGTFWVQFVPKFVVFERSDCIQNFGGSMSCFMKVGLSSTGDRLFSSKVNPGNSIPKVVVLCESEGCWTGFFKRYENTVCVLEQGLQALRHRSTKAQNDSRPEGRQTSYCAHRVSLMSMNLGTRSAAAIERLPV